MNHKGQAQIMTVAIGALIFIIVMVVYSIVYAQMNTSTFSVGVQNLIGLLPLVVVGTVIIGIIVIAFKLSN